MRKYLLLASVVFAGWLLPAVAQQIVQPGGSAGNIPAQTSNVQANVGAIGEFVRAKITDNSISATVSHASPAVVTMTSNTFAANCIVAAGSTVKCVFPVYFTGLTGVGISNNTTYYVDPASISGSTFSVATSVANALAGTDVNTTGTDSGTGIEAAYIASSATASPTMAVYLTPGDWDCSGNEAFIEVASNAPTRMAGDINSNATGTNPQDGSAFEYNWTFTSGVATNSYVLGVQQFILSSQTLVYMTGAMTYTGGSSDPVVEGQLRCRRVQ